METLVDLPEIEILSGVGYPKVSPQLVHFLVQGALVEVLRRCGKATGYAGTELRCRLDDRDGTTALIPDVAYISRDRLRAIPEDQRSEPPFAPDVVVEVRSPSERRGLRERKIARYLATGSVLVLDVDPATRKIHANAHDGVRTYLEGETFAHHSAPWLTFDVGYIFADID